MQKSIVKQGRLTCRNLHRIQLVSALRSVASNQGYYTPKVNCMRPTRCTTRLGVWGGTSYTSLYEERRAHSLARPLNCMFTLDQLMPSRQR